MKQNAKKTSRKKHLNFPLLCFLLSYVAALTVPYYSHKKVSDAFKQDFSQKTFYAENTGTERAAYLADNTEALVYRLKLIESAQEELIFSTFDFNDDKSGKDVMSALLNAADRGVKVRVIVDGVSGFLDMSGNSYFQALASHKNISVKRYNPVNLLKPWTLQARLHDKYIIADNSMYLLGGRNTTNLFLGDYSSHKNIDRELFVYEEEQNDDSSLQQLRQYFERVWALPESKDYICKKKTKEIQKAYKSLTTRYEKTMQFYSKALEDWDWTANTMPTDKITLLSNPIEAENKEPHMWYALSQLMQGGKNVTIYTPYIICGKEMYADLETICQKVSNVDIITNDVSSGANPWGCTDYLNQKEKIWKTGVHVYEYMGNHSCHTKAVLIDDTMTILGSYNLDMRSTYQDTELMLAVDSPELTAVIQKESEKDKTYSRIMTDAGEYEYGPYYHTKEMSGTKKIFYVALRILTIPIRRFL